MTIAEVCNKYGLTADTLRYYERVGLLPKVGRTAGGIRNYTDYDCNWVEFIKCMRNAGVSVESLVEYVRLFEQGDGTIERRKQILIDERERIMTKIVELQGMVELLDFKIEKYENVIIPVEEQLRAAV
ncbi:MAG: MerR family transcriptional regulator [Desulfarculales bacterium]|jgi:DNA-binding transcriptional MerR regulator|nr:MerR family transcriptional regulator [Desulfarculales bacterium]